MFIVFMNFLVVAFLVLLALWVLFSIFGSLLPSIFGRSAAWMIGPRKPRPETEGPRRLREWRDELEARRRARAAKRGRP
jgi:hypothetical protein